MRDQRHTKGSLVRSTARNFTEADTGAHDNGARTGANRLSSAQRQAATLLASSLTISETARQVGRVRQTVYAWLRIPAFKAEVARQEQEILADTRTELDLLVESLVEGQQSAVRALTSIVQFGTCSKDKIAASRALLSSRLPGAAREQE